MRGRWACVSPAVSQNTWWPVSQEAATSHQSGTTSERRSPIAAKTQKYIYVYFCPQFIPQLKVTIKMTGLLTVKRDRFRY